MNRIHASLPPVPVVVAAFLAGAACLFPPRPLGAQTAVVGVTVDADTGGPVAGVLVYVRVEGRREAGVLTRDDGGFALPVDGDARGELVAEALGYTTTVTPLSAVRGPVRLALTPSFPDLSGLDPDGDPVCRLDRDAARPLLGLWAEVGKTLRRTQHTEEAGRLELRSRTWRRTLDPATGETVEESDEFGGGIASLPPGAPEGSVLGAGYVQESEGAPRFFAPDGRTLLEPHFLATHCLAFRTAGDTLVGVAFSPSPFRSAPDLAGVAWLDGATARLRALDYRWVGLDLPYDTSALGGRVEFAVLPGGEAYVTRWVSRVPVEEGREAAWDPAVPGAESPTVRLAAVEETGAEVLDVEATGGRLFAGGYLEGRVVQDPGGRPVEGAVVYLSGTGRRATTGASGAFVLDDLRPGTHRVVAYVPGEARTRNVVADVEVGLDDTLRVQFHLPAPGPGIDSLLSAAGLEAEAAPGAGPGAAAEESPTPEGGATGHVYGTVFSGSRPLPGAEVSLADGTRTLTDGNGHFRLNEVPFGERVIETRHIGYVTRRDTVRVAARVTEVVVPLEETAVELEPLVVTVHRDPFFTNFFERRASGRGVYITHSEFDLGHPRKVTDIFSSVPGVRRLCDGGGCRLEMARVAQSQGEICFPEVYVDGTLAAGEEVTDLDRRFSPNDIAAIEVYRGPSEAPMRFNGRNQARCGVIVIWTGR